MERLAVAAAATTVSLAAFASVAAGIAALFAQIVGLPLL